MKQTAVEKIKSEFYSYAEPYNGFSEESKWTISEEDFEKLIEQVKEMEKQQQGYSEEDVINAFNEGQALNVRGKLIQGKEWFEQFKNK